MEDRGNIKADILEIYSSIQGEGPFMGIRQIFVRFAKCNLKCRFCDVEPVFSAKEFSVNKLLSIVKQICENCGAHHSVSLTGGEPLLYREFLKGFLPPLKEIGIKAYLETNGTLPDNLREVIEYVDIIAMDFKLPSSTGDKDCWREHKEFLNIAKEKNCFVKAVITSETNEADIKKAIDIVHDMDRNILLVLQPVWPVRDVKEANKRRLFDYLFLAEKRLRNVRIMPQMHKILKVS